MSTETTPPSDHARQAQALGEQAQDALATGTDPEPLLARALALLDAEARASEPLLVLDLLQLRCSAALQRARFEVAHRCAREALAIADRELEPDDLQIVELLNAAGMSCKYLARYDEGQAHYQRGLSLLAAHDQDHDEVHQLVCVIHHNLGGILHAEGRFADGEGWARAGVELAIERLGDQHPQVAADLSALAALVQAQGRDAEARQLYEQALAIHRRVDDRAEQGYGLHGLAGVSWALGQLDEAEAQYREALALKREQLGPDHIAVAFTLHDLALLVAERGRVDEGVGLCREALAVFRGCVPADHPELAQCERSLEALRGSGGAAG